MIADEDGYTSKRIRLRGQAGFYFGENREWL